MARIFRVALPYGVFLAAALLSWNRWMEPYVDGGRELEVPRRIAQGERLYRDVRFFHGPLGPWAAAAVERAIPRRLPARYGLCALVALLHLEALRRLSHRLLDPWPAALTASAAVAAAFFLRPGGCHLFPFSLDTSIASAAAAGALLAVAGRSGARGDAAAGAGVLAALMARPEMGFVLAAALSAEVVLAPAGAGRGAGRRLAALAGAPILLAGLLYAWVSRGVPIETLREEGWLALLGPPGSFRNIYEAYAGLDRPGLRLAELALAAILFLLAAALLVLLAFVFRRAATNVAAVAAALSLSAIGAALLFPAESWRESLSLLPPLVRLVPPVVLIAAGLRVLSRLRRRPPGVTAPLPDAMLYVAAYFSARMLLAAGYFGPYNAFLLPLSLVCALAVVFPLAAHFARKTGPGLPRLAAVSLAVFVAFRLADTAQRFRASVWSPVPTGGGVVMLPEPVASATRAALEDLSRRLSPGSTLVGFPEGGFFTWSLGAKNPLPQEQFFPGHLDAEEESATIARLQERPPDAILLANVLAVGHRARVFGQDYLRDLDGVLQARFSTAASYGPGAGPGARIGDPQFFVEIRAPRPVP